jgi:hypothetical protein
VVSFITDPAISKETLRELPLTEMVKRSNIVVLGKVVKVKKSATSNHRKESAFDEVAVATIAIEQVILGSYEDEQIDITYYPRLIFESHFWIGERCILFLMGERNLVVHGYAGKIPIQKERAEVLYIRGEPKNQTLKDFIEQIKNLKSAQGQSGTKQTVV